MTEKLFTGTLNQNQNKTKQTYHTTCVSFSCEFRTSTTNRNSNALNGHPGWIPLFILKGLDVQPLFVTHASALWHIMSTHLMNEEPKLYFLSTLFRNS